MRSINLLIRRGFIIDQNENGYYLSDNSDPHDKLFLEEILHSLDIGHVNQNGTIAITTDDISASKALLSLFAPVKRGTVGVGSCICSRSWSHQVRRRFHTPKIPVKWLEANIASYIKALSVCGIYTGGCCDGNHPDTDALYIEFEPPYGHIHKTMWECYLSSIFHLEWDKTYSSIDLKKDRQSQYDELFRAAQYIYVHRWSFISARLDAANWITKKTIKRIGERSVKKRFDEEFAKNLNKYLPEQGSKIL